MTIFRSMTYGQRYKEPRSYEMIGLALQGVMVFGGRLDTGKSYASRIKPVTAYEAAQGWGVSPHTARRWLNKWAEQGMLTKTWEYHRPGVHKAFYHIDLISFREVTGFHFGTVRARNFLNVCGFNDFEIVHPTEK